MRQIIKYYNDTIPTKNNNAEGLASSMELLKGN